MLRNEDWDFVYNKMNKKNYKLIYNPKSIIFHENANISQFIKKRFLYGFFMWPILKKLNLKNLYFYLPFFFSLFLISFPFIFYFKLYFTFYFFSFINLFFNSNYRNIKNFKKFNLFSNYFTNTNIGKYFSWVWNFKWFTYV